MTLYLIAICFFVAGFIIRRTLNCADNISEFINKLVICVILPVIIISTIPDLKISMDSGLVVLMPWLAFFAPLPLSIFVARKFHLNRQELVAIVVLSGLGNTAFLGVGLVQSAFGREAVPSAVLYDQLGSFLLVATVVSLLTAIYSERGTEKERPSIKSIVAKVLSFPPFLSLIIGLFIPSTEIYGESLNRFFSLLSLTIIPLSLFIIGLQIHIKVEQKYRFPLAYILAMKLICIPAFILLVSLFVGIQKPEFSTVVFQSAMPPMVTPAIMLIEAKIAPKLVASALGIGTVFAFASLSIWANLITKIII